jgi:hypothetical protein
MSMPAVQQIRLFSEDRGADVTRLRTGTAIDIGPLDATFQDSGRAPLHSWFPYLEGYSPKFVQRVRQEFLPQGQRILEPFAGSGTSPIVLGQAGVECAYSEANPAMAFIIQTKLAVLAMGSLQRQQLAQEASRLSKSISERARLAEPDSQLHDAYESSFGTSIFFNDGALLNVARLRTGVTPVWWTGSG